MKQDNRFPLAKLIEKVYKPNNELKLVYDPEANLDRMGILFDPEPTEKQKLLLDLILSDLIE